MTAASTTVAEWMTFAAVILSSITVAPLKAVGYKTFDNSNPRNPAPYVRGIECLTSHWHTRPHCLPWDAYAGSRIEIGAPESFFVAHLEQLRSFQLRHQAAALFRAPSGTRQDRLFGTQTQ